MKLFKKALAVALAGVLALSVLTGCGKDSEKTLSLVDAMNQYAKYQGKDVKVSRDAELDGKDGKAGKIFELLSKAVDEQADEDTDVVDTLEKLFEGKYDEETQKYKRSFPGSEAVMNCLGVTDFTGTTIYSLSFVDMSKTVSNGSALSSFRVMEIEENAASVNDPKRPAEGKTYKDGNIGIGTVTGKIKGKDIMLVVMKTELVEIDDPYAGGGEEEPDGGRDF